ncbi:Uncharacterised protein [Myroides odoratus]|uniref:Uncharacterized protein n=2 Tax=Myroides odoratus TaxID=256 RepID=A0A9Q6ZIB9_MYROD|nr:hypothetical protein Myrod_3701 [Myroides odoratus DSM 2801]EKB03682.1 hypothetical protein HMPREF9716_03511 [Myroides odoratus CIP 103059]QQU02005.1 hypothetical protein I6I88_08505 [Myroides odoratus]STZ31837.1 Uncharacterised protein [Myroides odoratus]
MLFYGEFLTKGIQKMGLLSSHYLVCKFLIQLPLQSKKEFVKPNSASSFFKTTQYLTSLSGSSLFKRDNTS